MTPNPQHLVHLAGNGAAPSRVLQTFVVEDNPVILDDLVATLEEMTPVRVIGHAADEVTALAQLEMHRGELDLVIVDIFLKAGSGLGVLRGALTTSLPARCVVLTNFVSADIRARCYALGADRVFDKSNDLDELMTFCCGLAERGTES